MRHLTVSETPAFPNEIQFSSELTQLIQDVISSIIAVRWLGLDLDLSHDALLNNRGSSAFIETFDLLKAFRKPLDLIPKTLHPIG